jgi:hypothetical protein
MGFELTTLVVIGTDYIGSCKSTTTTAQHLYAGIRSENEIVDKTNKADRQIITEILLKVALNTNPKPQVQILIKSNIPSIGMSRSYIPFNENGDSDFMKVLLNCFACYEQSDWSKKVITVFIISLYIHDIMSMIGV